MVNSLVYALSIRERADALYAYYNNSSIEDNITKWIKRKSLCTEKLFELALKNSGMTRKCFNIAIKPLNEKDIVILTDKLKKMEWYKKAKEILEDEEAYANISDIIDFSFSIRPFSNYLKKKIDNIKIEGYTLNDTNIFCDYLVDEFVQIASRTLVYDLHEQKKQFMFKGETPNERFRYYMKKRFYKKKSLISFYEEYPVLLRLLTERVTFHENNIKMFIQSIEHSLSKFQKKFLLSRPYIVSVVSVGKGDSHGKGKTVILFKVNEKHFVYKPKCLEIGERFNDFLTYIETKTGNEFFKVKRIVKSNYCIEEFVEKKDLKSEKEAKKFYYYFGEYVALSYFLCGMDFHCENLVAHGEYPVLIDVETFIQNSSLCDDIDNPYVKISGKKASSVLASALLPFKFNCNRIEPLVRLEAQKQGLNVSAFDGKKQKVPYKGLGLVNLNTDNVRFEYIEYELEETNNIPTLRGEDINANNYKLDIVNGFNELCMFFFENKNNIISVIQELFKDITVRNVLKSTQKYMDIIGFSHHPECMKDYIEREKLFENLWAYDYKNKIVIPTEIKELLVDDVPIFYNNTSTRDLITSEGKTLKNYYEQTALERIKNRIVAFDKKEYLYQKLQVELSLNIYKIQTLNINIGNSAISALKNITRIINTRAKYNKEKSIVAFEDFVYRIDGTLDYNSTDLEFYDGLSGLYLFVLQYTKHFLDTDMESLRLALENTMFRLANSKKAYEILSVYAGKYSILYPLYYKYKIERKKEDLLFAKDLLKNIERNIKVNTKGDWLTGVSGVIQVLVNYYKLTQDEFFLEKAEKLTVFLSKIDMYGFSHGYSGVIYAAYSLYDVTGKIIYFDLIRECLRKERAYFLGEKNLNLYEEKELSWCKGAVGIGMTRLYLLKNRFPDKQIQKEFLACLRNVMKYQCEEASICHGNMGCILFLEEIIKTHLIPEEIQNEVERSLKTKLEELYNQGIVIGAFENNCCLGLMTGIAGVGYGLLKVIDKKIPNLLYLE